MSRCLNWSLPPEDYTHFYHELSYQNHFLENFASFHTVQSALLLISHFAACTTLSGQTFKDSAELLYCNFLFKFTFLVHASLGNRGNNETEFVTSAGTFTIFP